MKAQAAARGLRVPDTLEAYWRGEARPFGDFIEAFLFGAGFLGGPEAVKAAIQAIGARLPPPNGGPRGVDLWVSPHFLVRFKQLLTLDELWRGLEEGIAEARQQGIAIAVVVEAVNHFGPTHGHEVLDLVLGELPEFVAGFSTGGLEGVPFGKWAPVFDRARSEGLRLAAHAGENGPGENVREAILHAGVSRIVHGVRAADDPSILELLAERRIAVDICLTSNAALVPDLGVHPLPGFLRAGVRCALGTDDPGVIPCTLGGEWSKAQAMGLTEGELRSLLVCAEEDAWCLGR